MTRQGRHFDDEPFGFLIPILIAVDPLIWIAREGDVIISHPGQVADVKCEGCRAWMRSRRAGKPRR